ncbi:MAG: hypothetical protein ABH824_07550 [Nanoarchaeota archaeon]|nr:hypothetical protein [Nanoarchaeota archaeon]MBU1632227.1 hypothetical protein [Nanoarchaeota archaeon]MBU1875811.1 hypothetical protein [Nanoarchaeota archaeon]
MTQPNVMDWSVCKESFIRQVYEDPERIKSIIKQANQRLKRVNNTEISEETVSFIIEDYYEVIKELLIAYLLKDGMRSKNHQCLFSYFHKKNPEYETEVVIILQMSHFRNRLCYYGESIPVEFYEKNKEKFIQIINIITNSLL